MALLDEAIEASGGLARWSELKRFTLQVSIDGELFSRANWSAEFKEIVAEGCIRDQQVRLSGFASHGGSGVYRTNRVTIEDPDGNVLRTWHDPHQAFQRPTSEISPDELLLIFLCGCSLWNYLATPFVLAQPGVRVEELAPWNEHGQLWRRLHAVFPPTFVTHSYDQTFYFDAEGLQRRTDHSLFGIKVADYSWAHQEFGGIVVPTLRRSLTIGSGEAVTAKAALVDVEIFDAAFE
jgi:hypothetical protein